MPTLEQEHDALKAWEAADNAWQAELERVYKSRAGDARYTSKGIATPELARLHAAFRDAKNAYYQIRSARQYANV